jgi:hypothetical protein
MADTADGLSKLGQAMAKKLYQGSGPRRDKLGQYDAFWSTV